MTKIITGVLLTSSLILIGCGGTSSNKSTTSTNNKQVGYFVDSAVESLDYDCLADGDMNLTTGTDGNFTCHSMDSVRFRIGNLILGEINSLPSDKHVMPQDLVGVDRADINNTRVIEIARLLQSFDSDHNPENGISITNSAKKDMADNLEVNTTFDENITDDYLESAGLEINMTKEKAREHLHATLQTIREIITKAAGAQHGRDDLNDTSNDDYNATAAHLVANEIIKNVGHAFDDTNDTNDKDKYDTSSDDYNATAAHLVNTIIKNIGHAFDDTNDTTDKYKDDEYKDDEYKDDANDEYKDDTK